MANPKRVGIFGRAGGGSFEEWKTAFPPVFASHGFVNGRNLALEFYGFDVPESRRETATSAELIESGRHMAGSMARAGLDCIVSNGEATTRWLFEATRSVPIVANVGDPVALGFAQSLARPGGNVTGLHSGGAEIALKSVELMKRIVPSMAGFAWIGWRQFRDQARAWEAAAREVGVRFRALAIEKDGAEGLVPLRLEVGRLRAQGFTAVAIAADRDAVLALAAAARKERIAVVGPTERWDNVLLAYGAKEREGQDATTRLPAIVARVLRGESPAAMPFEGPLAYHIGVNLKTAAAIGVTIPDDLLVLADDIVR